MVHLSRLLPHRDSANYRYQIKTGMLGKYHRTKLNDHVLTMIKRHAQTSGIEKSYTGVSGGGQSYVFSNNDGFASLKIIDELSRKNMTITNEPFDNVKNCNKPLMVMFEISGDNMKRFNVWKISKSLTDDESGYRFKFVPTGLGMVKIVSHIKSRKRIDLTDYDNW